MHIDDYPALDVVMMVSAAVSGVLMIYIKAVNISKGHAAHWIRHSKAVQTFRQVIADEQNDQLRKRYKISLYAFLISIAVFVALFLASILGNAFWQSRPANAQVAGTFPSFGVQ